MAKIFKISGYFVDPNGDYSAEDLEIGLEDDFDMIAKHIKVEEKDIGEWDDDIPLNYCDSAEIECEKYFKDEVVTLFEIVPVNDGSHYMCKNSNGEYYQEHKAYTVKEQLAFDTEATAQKYIDKYLNADLYKPEMFGYNLKYLPCKLITKVE